MVNINLIPKDVVKNQDELQKQEYDIATNADRKIEEKNAKVDPRMKGMSEEEYQQMYNSGYIQAGVKTEKIKCKCCGQVKDCSVASKMYSTRLCSYCFKRNKKQVERIEI